MRHYSYYRQEEKPVKEHNFLVLIDGEIMGRKSFKIVARTIDLATEIAISRVFNCSSLQTELTFDGNMSKVTKGKYFFEVMKVPANKEAA